MNKYAIVGAAAALVMAATPALAKDRGWDMGSMNFAGVSNYVTSNNVTGQNASMQFSGGKNSNNSVTTGNAKSDTTVVTVANTNVGNTNSVNGALVGNHVTSNNVTGQNLSFQGSEKGSNSVKTGNANSSTGVYTVVNTNFSWGR